MIDQVFSYANSHPLLSLIYFMLILSFIGAIIQEIGKTIRCLIHGSKNRSE